MCDLDTLSTIFVIGPFMHTYSHMVIDTLLARLVSGHSLVSIRTFIGTVTIETLLARLVFSHSMVSISAYIWTYGHRDTIS